MVSLRVLFARMLTEAGNASATQRGYERYRRFVLSVGSGILVRLVIIAANLVTIPLLLDYLGPQQFALWGIICSLANWIKLADLGLPSGLVNLISMAHGTEDKESAARWVSSAFFVLSAITLLALALTLIMGSSISWSSLLHTEALDPRSVRLAVIYGTLPVLLATPFSIGEQVFGAYQKKYLSDVFWVVSTVLSVIAVVLGIMNHLTIAFLLFFAGLAAFVTALARFAYLTRKIPWVMPLMRHLSWDALRALIALSFPLFLFQVGAALINQTQLLLLPRFVTLSDVSRYSVLLSFCALLMTITCLTTSPLVPSFREARDRGDLAWFRQAFRRLIAFRMLLAFFVAVSVMLFGNSFLHFWIRRSDLVFDHLTWLVVALLIVSATWVTIYNELMIIMDKIWSQVVLALANGAVTIGLTLLLAPRFGILGTIISLTAFTVLVSSWVNPWLAYAAVPALREQ